MNTARDIRDKRFVGELARFRPYNDNGSNGNGVANGQSEDKTPQAGTTEAEILTAKKLIFGEREIPSNVSIEALMSIMRHISKGAGMPYKYQTNLKDANVRRAYEKYCLAIGEYNFPLSDEQRLDFDFLYLIDSAQDEKEKEQLISQRNEKARAMQIYKLLTLWELRQKGS